MLKPTELKAEQFPLPSWPSFPAKPEYGDSEIRATYEAIGIALSQFEKLDAVLSHMFGLFVSGNPETLPTRRAYGSPRSFDVRRNMLQEAAQIYIGIENEEFYRHFKSLLKIAKKLGFNRNDIAHGVVTEFYNIRKRIHEPEKGWCIVPSYADTSKIHMHQPNVWIAEYCLTSKEITLCSERFREFLAIMAKIIFSLSDINYSY